MGCNQRHPGKQAATRRPGTAIAGLLDVLLLFRRRALFQIETGLHARGCGCSGRAVPGVMGVSPQTHYRMMRNGAYMSYSICQFESRAGRAMLSDHDLNKWQVTASHGRQA